jgi:hypothetical protein
VGLGWRWRAANHFVIRAAVDPVTNEIYLTYFKRPVMSLGAGYRS